MKKECLGFVLILVVSGLISASFQVGNLSNSLTEEYPPGGVITGWINISLANEPIGSVFEYDSKTISIVDLLESQSNSHVYYECNPISCESDYSKSFEANSKSYTDMISGQSEVIGFEIVGKGLTINSIDFQVESSSGTSCDVPFEIDFFNDKTLIVSSNKSSGVICANSKSYGCFDTEKTAEEFNIGSTPYCQKIKLKRAPGFRLGIWVKEQTSGSSQMTMSLYEDSSKVAECALPGTTSTTGEEIFCDIDYLVTKQKDYYVCVSGTGSGVYRIKGYEDSSNKCGFYGNPLKQESAAYQIFIETKKYAAIGTLDVSTDSIPENPLNDAIENYITKKYGSLNCENGCIIPMKLTSWQNSQTLTIKNLNLNYDKSTGNAAGIRPFYDLSKTVSTITADFQKIYVDDANFTAPPDIDEFDFDLTLGGNSVLTEELSVASIPVILGLEPRTAASLFPTEFEVKVASSTNITRYKWEFGDNETKTTTSNKTTHTYGETGNYDFKVTITDSGTRKVSKTFSVVVRSPKEEINKTLEKKKSDLASVKNQIKAFKTLLRNSIDNFLELDMMESALGDVEDDFASASSVIEYTNIISDLSDIVIPEDIKISTSAEDISFFPATSEIDVETLTDITGETYDGSKRRDYRDSIIAWNVDNLETTLDFKEVLIDFGSGNFVTLNVFSMRLKEIGEVKDSVYLLVKDIGSLTFSKDYGETLEGNYYYISIENFPQTFSFSTTADVDFTTLPAFISPKISELALIEVPSQQDEDDNSKWITFLLIFAFVLVGGFVTYVILQEWYRKKYENHLFKNRNNLLNLLTYIENTKRKGLKGGEIVKKLKKAGWNYEQIRYAIRKHAGKRTGMVELIKIKKKEKANTGNPLGFSQKLPQSKGFKRF